MTEKQKNIKNILKRWPLMKSRIKLLERRLLTELPPGTANYSSVGHVSCVHISDSTAIYAIRREALSKELDQLRQELEMIETAVSFLVDDERQIIEKHYGQGWQLWRLEQHLNMSARTTARRHVQALENLSVMMA